MLSHSDMLLRVAAGAALGSVIGYERGVHQRPVGLRTHSIVAMAAATFMVVSSQFVYFQHYGRDDLVVVDTSRIAAAVVTGIGFLAGGTILRTGINVQGLTTAAGLWLVTAIGMCAGSGMYVESLAITGLGLVVLTFFRRLESKNVQRWRITVDLTADDADKTPVLDVLRELGAATATLDYQVHPSDGAKTVTVDARLAAGITANDLVDALQRRTPVKRVRVEHDP